MLLRGVVSWCRCLVQSSLTLSPTSIGIKEALLRKMYKRGVQRLLHFTLYTSDSIQKKNVQYLWKLLNLNHVWDLRLNSSVNQGSSAIPSSQNAFHLIVRRKVEVPIKYSHLVQISIWNVSEVGGVVCFWWAITEILLRRCGPDTTLSASGWCPLTDFLAQQRFSKNNNNKKNSA